MPTPSAVLPPWYAAAFAAAPMPGERAPHVWAYRAWIGEWKRAPLARPAGDAPHFNDAEPGADAAGLGDALLALEGEIAPLLSALGSPRALAASERAALARFVALLAVRNAPHAAELGAAEARAGAEALERTLADMGWVFWTAPPGVHLVTGSSPFHAAFPRGEESRTAAFELADPSVELTLPLSPGLALHATWRRRGELWRRAREEVLLELNGRTCASSRRFLLAPVPQVPG
ncbi:MAG TPA: hypothetical protein VFL83_10155 [Anaeromyxobacter sp.]|nr:hypothetical protein [Anaeromyxobacter sp.]